MTKDRPELTKEISVHDFKDYYWLKEELTAFCKEIGIAAFGGKLAISKCIETFLESGTVTKLQAKKKPSSSFNWSKEILSLQTILTDSYRNTENVRLFMTQHIGSHFHFTVCFMNWAKQNTGKSLAEAITEWNLQHEYRKNNSLKTTIAPQFEYNRYIRTFLHNNSDKTLKDAIQYWNMKKQTRGSKEYNPSDLNL